jgi:type III pantothenate kinase
MSVNLCIDWGNSLVKASIFNDNKLEKTVSYNDNEAYEAIAGIIDKYQPLKGILCSVVNHPEAIQAMLQERIKYFLYLDNNTRVPVMNAYSSPGTLGADRLALVVAAQNAYPDKNNLVISLGTCITYNFIGKNRTYRGGAISPGLEMRLKAMHHFTDKLPTVSMDGDLLLLGYDTETGMRSGAFFGMLGELEGMLQQFADQYADFNAILTGGNASLFASKLKSKIFADPDILAKGLNLILNYNVPQTR